MATIREGHRPVLMVVDLQVGVVGECWESPRVLANAALAVARARAQGVPVIWVQHQNGEMPEGSPAWQWAEGLVPTEGELRIHKRFNSAFEQTPLDAELQRLQATHIVLAGAASNWCIRATAYAALDRGYDLTLVADAHTTSPVPRRDAPEVTARDVIDDLNTVMTWVEYPGRKNGTAEAAALDFRLPERPAWG